MKIKNNWFFRLLLVTLVAFIFFPNMSLAGTISFDLQLSSSNLKTDDVLRITPLWKGNTGSYYSTQNKMTTTVNGQLVGTINNVSTNDIRNQALYQEVVVKQSNGFKDGSNVIVVNLIDPYGTSYGTQSQTVSVNLNTTSSNSTAPSGKIYACKAGNGAYACSPANKNDLSDVTATDGDCSQPARLAILVDSSWCGKTDAQINQSQTTNTAPKTTASPPTPNTGNNGNINVKDCTGPNADPNYCLYNPLPVDNLTSTLLLITKGFLGIVAIWSVAFIIIGGFRMVMSQGNEEAVGVAKKTITYAVIGLAIAMLSFSIIAIIQYILQVKIQDVSTKTGLLENVIRYII